MSEIRSWSAKSLIAYLRELYEMIYVVECFGTRDLGLYNAIINELDRRGYLTGKIKIGDVRV